MRMWEGIDIQAVKADWAMQLGWYQNDPGAIAHALECLPVERPPTVSQFRELCRRSPVEAPKQLPAPKPDKQRLAEVLASLKAMTTRRGADWARRLQEREQAGERLSAAQRRAWRQALVERASESTGQIIGDFRPIPSDVLPPGMRT
jgi:uncharacterized membrane protein